METSPTQTPETSIWGSLGDTLTGAIDSLTPAYQAYAQAQAAEDARKAAEATAKAATAKQGTGASGTGGTGSGTSTDQTNTNTLLIVGGSVAAVAVLGLVLALATGRRR
ncbi:MAG: hypothetical protein LBK99_06485 [Opitutaceae bacterium]|jgi:hypothetical protein|nr:hypothetical protein [Opitutaceae bacterium]